MNTLYNICINYLLQNKTNFVDILKTLPNELQIELMSKLTIDLVQMQKQMIQLKSYSSALNAIIEFTRSIDEIQIMFDNPHTYSDDVVNVGNHYIKVRRAFRGLGNAISQIEALLNLLNR